jgi:hypothetical protein
MGAVITQGRYHPEIIVKTECYAQSLKRDELPLVKS